MATIKSFTDLEQSKKLAEILPLESADMMYSPPMITHFRNYGDADKEQELPDYMVTNVRRNIINDSKFDEPIPIRKGDFPAWSLAALISVLPKIENYRLEIRRIESGYCCCYTEENNGGDLYWYYADNPIDACVAMVEELHELKML